MKKLGRRSLLTDMVFCISIPIAQFTPTSNSRLMFVMHLVLLVVIIFTLMNWPVCQRLFSEIIA